ncbi:MAG: hypothetical protein BAA01_15650 [Bacillus thermozeamaize]|uniref:RCK C-terminal domain-containing protein n=1 Tax=Bacillus thermozeamaize TaxID=230954 RepID=A0A1Y3PHQ5_9BACI|nr:MAG: hypothetical protein BAA01_15650 [Bacillus thermozeamaize]
MGHVNLTSLMVVVLVAFLVPILIHRTRLAMPVVVAEILAGMLIGQTGFNLIKPDAWLELLSLLGFIYLMFLSGLEIDFSMITASGRKKGKVNPLVAGSGVFILILLLSFVLALGLAKIGLVDDFFLMTIIIATISLGVVLPTLKEKGIERTEIGQIFLIIAVLSDFVTMILLAVYVSFHGRGSGGKVVFLLFLFLAVFLAYRIAKMLMHGRGFEGLEKATSQIGVRGAFALILFFVALAESVGAEGILGAFLAGATLSLLSPRREFVHKLDSFGYGFLIPIFFVMVGVRLDLHGMLQEPHLLLLVPLLLLILFLSKMLPMLLLRIWFPGRIVLAGGVFLTATLSLVIAAGEIGMQLGLLTSATHTALVLTAVVSSIVSPILFDRIFPKQESRPMSVHILGASTVTLPLVNDLVNRGVLVKVFTTEATQDGDYPFVRLEQLEKETLRQTGFFHADVVVCGTGNGKLNLEIALAAKELGMEHVVCILEDPLLQEEARKHEIHLFSSALAGKAYLKAMVLFPRLLDWITLQDEASTLVEVRMQNPMYEGRKLREIPFLGDALILRIYRDDESITPHGDTVLQLGDTLLVSGGLEHVTVLREHFS